MQSEAAPCIVKAARAKASFISQARPREANGRVIARQRLSDVVVGAFNRAKRRFFSSIPLCTPFTISTTLDRSSIAVSLRESSGTDFRSDRRFTGLTALSTGSLVTLVEESKRHGSEVAGLIEHQRTISILLGNIDTLAQIPQYVVSTSRLTEIARSDVKVSQVDPGLCQFRRGYYKIARQHRTRYGRFSGLVD